MVIDKLKMQGTLPTSVVLVVDKENLADNMIETNPNPPVPLYSYHYVWKRFNPPSVIEEFYTIHKK